MNNLTELKKISKSDYSVNKDRIFFGDLLPEERKKILENLEKINQEILDLPNLK